MGKYAVKENSKTGFFYALDRKEKTASLHVDYTKNTAFDFGTGKKYDVVNIVQMIKMCSVADALEILKKFDISTFQVKNSITEMRGNSYEILTVKEIKTKALFLYLESRGLLDFKDELFEIHYKSFDKRYYGIGFKNNSNGYEFSNSLGFKRCLGRKDISHFKNEFDKISVFESWSDYFSFKAIYKNQDQLQSDFLVLNSVSMIQKSIEILENYSKIDLYLDNDDAGNSATETLLKQFSQAVDNRKLYFDYKDLNEMLKSSLS